MKKILVIDDEESIRTGVVDLLSAEGYQAVGASNGYEGCKVAIEDPPDLILCDVSMPQRDGYEVLTELKKEEKTATIPFIFLTGKSESQSQRVGMNLGADDYLTKPFTRRDLMRSIAARLEKQEMQAFRTREKVDQLRLNLARSLPHEFLTPLNVILGYSELIQDEAGSGNPEETLESAQKIQNAAKRLQRLLQNFLLYAELNTLSGDAEQMKAMLSGEVSGLPVLIAEIAVQKAGERNLDLQLEIEEATVQIADASFRRLIEELLDNAFRYSQAGPVCVTGKVVENRYQLVVTDHGRGMSDEQIKSIGAFVQFERRFYEQQGAGLGLAIVKQLVQLHGGGEFRIESVPGQKTMVHVALRLSKAKAN